MTTYRITGQPVRFIQNTGTFLPVGKPQTWYIEAVSYRDACALTVSNCYDGVLIERVGIAYTLWCHPDSQAAITSFGFYTIS